MRHISIDTIKPGMTSVYTHSLQRFRCIIARLSARKWHLSFDEWIGAEWRTQTTIGTYPSQAVALVHAGAWLQDKSADPFNQPYP